METTSDTQNVRSEDIRVTYLRVLRSNPPDKADWNAAKELMDGGYATGSVLMDRRTLDGGVYALRGFAPTMSGRLYAEQLEQELRQANRKRRFGWKAWSAIVAIGGVILASAHAVTNDVLGAWIKHLLGLGG